MQAKQANGEAIFTNASGHGRRVLLRAKRNGQINTVLEARITEESYTPERWRPNAATSQQYLGWPIQWQPGGPARKKSQPSNGNRARIYLR